MPEHASHGYAENKPDLVNRLRRAEGQVRGIERMVSEDRYCIDILTQIAALQAALDKVALELMDDHVHHCMVKGSKQERLARADELMGTIARLMR